MSKGTKNEKTNKSNSNGDNVRAKENQQKGNQGQSDRTKEVKQDEKQTKREEVLANIKSINNEPKEKPVVIPEVKPTTIEETPEEIIVTPNQKLVLLTMERYEDEWKGGNKTSNMKGSMLSTIGTVLSKKNFIASDLEPFMKKLKEAKGPYNHLSLLTNVEDINTIQMLSFLTMKVTGDKPTVYPKIGKQINYDKI